VRYASRQSDADEQDGGNSCGDEARHLEDFGGCLPGCDALYFCPTEGCGDRMDEHQGDCHAAESAVPAGHSISADAALERWCS
jgi:hypothetical protein